MYKIHTTHYVIDWDKIESLDDLKKILKKVNLSFSSDTDVSEIENLVKIEKLPTQPIFVPLSNKL